MQQDLPVRKDLKGLLESLVQQVLLVRKESRARRVLPERQARPVLKVNRDRPESLVQQVLRVRKELPAPQDQQVRKVVRA